jgi:hypothetical protein
VKQQLIEIATDDRTGLAAIIAGLFLGFFNWWDIGKFGVASSIILALTMAFCHFDKNRRERILFEQEQDSRRDRRKEDRLPFND